MQLFSSTSDKLSIRKVKEMINVIAKKMHFQFNVNSYQNDYFLLMLDA